MAVQAGYIASWQLSPARIMGPPEAVTPEPSIQHPLPLELLPYTEALNTNLFDRDRLPTHRCAQNRTVCARQPAPRPLTRAARNRQARLRTNVQSRRAHGEQPGGQAATQRGEPCVVEFAGTIVGEQLATLRSI